MTNSDQLAEQVAVVTTNPVSETISTSLSVDDLLNQVQQIQKIMAKVMVPDEHYGVIPGTGTKPSLLKPGAEKLLLTFQLHPEFKIEKEDLGNGHREYEITCRLLNNSERFIAEGVATCSTMESKYRYRAKQRSCPACGSETIFKSKREDGFYCWQKRGGCGAQFGANDAAIINQSEGKIENPDLADTYNTVKKIAKKRALVDAVITATAASDIFSQDLEVGEPASPIKEAAPPLPPEPVSSNFSSDDIEFKQPVKAIGKKVSQEINTDSIRFSVQFKNPPDPTQKTYLKNAGYKYDPLTYTWMATDTPDASKLYDTLITKKTELLQHFTDTNANQIPEFIGEGWSDSEGGNVMMGKGITIEENKETISDDKVAFMKECADRKTQLGETIYYETLNKHGIAKSNRVHADDIKTMNAIILDLSENAKKRQMQ